MPWLAALLPVVTGAIGAASSASDRNAARSAQQEALALVQRTGLPPNIANQIVLQQYQNAGKLTPQLEQALKLGPSAVAGIQEDPQTRQAQMSALSALQQRGQTGLSPEDRASLNQVRNQINTDAEGRRQQILQNFQARGQGGSGSELAAALQAGSNSQNQASEQGDRLAGLSSQRALESMVAGGQLGGQLRSQDFNVANTKAQAQDAINRFNTQNMQNVSNTNTGINNNAQQYNLANQQRLSDMNTGVANTQQSQRLNAQQNYWNNLQNYYQGQANAESGFANNMNQNANNTAQQWANIGAGASAGVGAAANYSNQQQMLDAYKQRTQAMQNNNGSGSGTYGSDFGGGDNWAGSTS